MKTKLFLFSLLCSGFVNAQTIGLELYVGGFNSPVDIAHDPDGRMYVVEQGGAIKLVADSDGDDDPEINTYLNIASLVDDGANEGGLLGLAFHPDYETNGYFFINYTNPGGDTVIARYTVSGTDENAANPASAVILMTIEQPFSNHNGGCLRFGPDGYLYIGTGDGGSGGDPGNRAQNTDLLLGKMLRIDVDTETSYASPAGNPYIGVAGADEIWAIGLRNPWKFSFNRLNGDLWIADVGQENREEVNKAAATAAGLNYGWRCYEGTDEFNMTQCDGISGFTVPFADYSSSTGSGNCSVTGGYVYTGTDYPNLLGKYIFADYCSNKIGILNTTGDMTFSTAFAGTNFTTFGEDNDGELYVAGISNGNVYKIIDTTAAGTANFAGGTYTVYPNPASDEVFVDFQNIAGPASVSIVDLRGKTLVQQSIAEGTSRIDTAGLSTGMYLMRLESGGAVTHHKLVIK